jgi:hypothetical protein
MMVFVRAVSRVILLLLVAGLSGGSALLDGCLVSCHPEPGGSNARTGHCHTASAAATQSHLQAIPRCCHDAPSGLADTTDVQARLMAGSFVALTQPAVEGHPQFTHQAFASVRYLPPVSGFHPLQTPLRL